MLPHLAPATSPAQSFNGGFDHHHGAFGGESLGASAMTRGGEGGGDDEGTAGVGGEGVVVLESEEGEAGGGD
ncbi:hypothetical protein IAT38_008264 [Cryptococcus sp. DSM 104549]